MIIVLLSDLWNYILQFFLQKAIPSEVDWNKAFQESSGVWYELGIWQNVSTLNYTFKQQLGKQDTRKKNPFASSSMGETYTCLSSEYIQRMVIGVCWQDHQICMFRPNKENRLQDLRK